MENKSFIAANASGGGVESFPILHSLKVIHCRQNSTRKPINRLRFPSQRPNALRTGVNGTWSLERMIFSFSSLVRRLQKGLYECRTIGVGRKEVQGYCSEQRDVALPLIEIDKQNFSTC